MVGTGKVRPVQAKVQARNSRYTLEMMEERREREHQMILDTVRRETEIRVRREIEEERAIRPEKPDKMWK